MPGAETLFEHAEKTRWRPGEPAGPVVFDLETLRSAQDVGGWGNLSKMGMALAVVYYTARDAYETFHEHEADALAEALLASELVVGFNHVHFDYGVLRGCTSADLSKTRNLDLLLDLKRKLNHRLSLNAVAGATLNAGKSGDGLQSLQWVKEGRLDLVEQYCRKDVEITHRVWRFGVENGYVLYDSRDGVKRVEVEWK
jgi:DEAD/DEAH box helicase domain-containing protein